MPVASVALRWPHAAEHAVRSQPSPRSTPMPPLVLRAHTGESLSFDLDRWHGPASAEERELLSRVRGPAIDLGCGPGRVVASLARQGIRALGVDSSASAVALARRRGTNVIDRDIFGPLPGEGRWATALLFDGTIGIGGDPSRLLTRCAQLICPGGRVLVEVDPPGAGCRRVTAWFERQGEPAPAFDWAIVGADAVSDLARPAGLRVSGLQQLPSGRWFAHLEAGVA